MKSILSETLKEIKRERLQKHLNEEVPNLVLKWVKQLSPPHPLSNQGGHVWAWQSPYTPAPEQDPDSNHILRRHLRSRALWRHHADWESRMRRVFELTKQAQAEAETKMADMITNPQEVKSHESDNIEIRVYTPHYEGSALFEAFNLARGRKERLPYRLNETPDAPGAFYGVYLIEKSTSSNEQLAEIEKEHSSLIWSLAFELKKKEKKTTVGELAKEWQETAEVAGKIKNLATKALKENDIFYPCRFCRRLW